MSRVEELRNKVVGTVKRYIVGYDKEVELMLVALLSGGHVLVEGPPGTGKTLTAKLFAQSLGLEFKRIQMAPDMLPGDIIGAKIVDPKTGELRTVLGPIYSNIVLVDELNRASPKTQSALLEAMQEGIVNIEGEEIELPKPFMVIATINPYEREGIFPLPIASLDRFMVSIEFNYLDHNGELEVLRRHRSLGIIEPRAEPVTNPREIVNAMEDVGRVHVDDNILEYILDITRTTRNFKGVVIGASTRAAVHLLRASRAYAAIHGRSYVTPDDVKAIAVPVLAHRIITLENVDKRKLVESIVSQVKPPW